MIRHIQLMSTLFNMEGIVRTLQVFILPFKDLKVLQSFLVRILYFEELSTQRSRLLLGSIKVSLSLLILLLPFRQNLWVVRR